MAYANSYLEDRIQAATGVELVRILYSSAIEAVAHARRHLNQGEIRERSRQITKAWEIVNELARALDHRHQMSRALEELYVYMMSRLLEANARQADAPLAEVGHLLGTLAGAWNVLADTDATY
jgi:flagellar protein FliS